MKLRVDWGSESMISLYKNILIIILAPSSSLMARLTDLMCSKSIDSSSSCFKIPGRGDKSAVSTATGFSDLKPDG